MIADKPEVKAEVEAQFASYEQALAENNVAALNQFFWDDHRAVRFGVAENLYGWDQIAAFRAARSPAGLGRRVVRQVITTYGQDFATTSLEFQRLDSGRTGRQSQAWARGPDGWHIVTAHVSLMADQP